MAKFSFKDRFFLPKYNDADEIRPGEVCIDISKCTGCTFCVQVCPAKALLIENKKSVLRKTGNMCVFCGDCVVICPEQAICLKTPFEYQKYYKTIHTGDPSLPRLFDT